MRIRILGCNVRKKGVHLQFEINTCIFVCLFCRKGVPLLYFVISALHFDFSADSCVAWFSKRVHFEDQWKLNSRKSWRLLGHYVISGPIVICIRYIVHCVLCFQFRILKKFKVTKPRTVSVTSSTWRSFWSFIGDGNKFKEGYWASVPLKIDLLFSWRPPGSF